MLNIESLLGQIPKELADRKKKEAGDAEAISNIWAGACCIWARKFGN